MGKNELLVLLLFTLTLTQKQLDKKIALNQLVTCGNVTDPRIQVAVDIASALTLIFRSDDKTPHNGIRLLVMEINTDSYSVRCDTKVYNITWLSATFAYFDR